MGHPFSKKQQLAIDKSNDNSNSNKKKDDQPQEQTKNIQQLKRELNEKQNSDLKAKADSEKKIYIKQNEQSWQFKQSKLTQQLNNLKNKLANFDKQSKQMENKNKQINTLTQNLKILNQEKLKAQSIKNRQLQWQFKQSKLTQQLNNFKNKLANFDKQSKQMEKTNKTLQNQNRQLTKKLQNYEFNHIFQGKLLHSCPKERSFLRKSIEHYLNKKIQYTKFIYNFDKINPVNFHQYIDGVPNICTIVSTVKGALLAGFSVDPLSSSKIAGDKGLLLSLSNQKVWKCLNNKRSVTYDQFHFIYGNSELRLRTGDTKIFSNFGINARCFQNKGEDVSQFIGQNYEREVDIVTYDIFEIVFDP